MGQVVKNASFLILSKFGATCILYQKLVENLMNLINEEFAVFP